jgi:hypothetical protein
MEMTSFIEIRMQHPGEFLVLEDYSTKELPTGQLEVLAARHVYAYDSGEEMYRKYREMSKQGRKVVFCTPNYTDTFIMEQRVSMRVMGA